MRHLLLLPLLCLLLGKPPAGHAQQEGLLQIGDPVHRLLQRQYALGRLPGAFLSNQPLSAYAAQQLLDSLQDQAAALDAVDRALLRRYRGEVPGPGTRFVQRYLPFLYQDGHTFFSVTGLDYAFEISPLLYLTYGRAQQTDREGRPASITTWQNTRGVRFAGHVGRHVFFEARLEENQRRPVHPEYDRPTAPRLGYTKFYRDDQVLDYWVATGIAGFRSDHFEIRFGRDRNRWGFGTGSLILSNYGPVYDQLQLRTTVWRLQYTNLFVRLTDLPEEGFTSSAVLPRKYGAFHRLAFALPGRVQLELFESIVFAADTTGANRRSGFELAYLNPIIFYRAVEADLGSPDNALLGGGVSWVATPGLQLYGQLLLDELDVAQIGDQWWANKWGWLLGLYVVNPGIPNLSARLEVARQRPYLYSHRTSTTALAHYGDGLGHPAGPNTWDLAFFLDYRPLPRLYGALNAAYTVRGRNTEEENYGSDPTRSYNSRVSDYGVEMLQGVRQRQLLMEAQVGYELLPELYLEAALRVESVDDEEDGLDRYVHPFLMLRWGLPFQSVRY